MISFVNAKINIGLQVVGRRADGYHDLQTLFYPVGLFAGTPSNPVEFCDILEVIPLRSLKSLKTLKSLKSLKSLKTLKTLKSLETLKTLETLGSSESGEAGGRFSLSLAGRSVDCPPEKNLVWRAADIYMSSTRRPDLSVSIRLEKHLPDGAGMGGGSADAAFTLLSLRNLERALEAESPLGVEPPGDEDLAAMALRLGADCPFFLLNRPAFAAGVGERLAPVPLDLSGMWLVVVKPVDSVSTRDAFAGITPRPASFDLRKLPEVPPGEWRDVVHNDFEDSIFPRFPYFAGIKQAMYDAGALYSSLTGSGSCIYGIFSSRGEAEMAIPIFDALPTILHSYLLQL